MLKKVELQILKTEQVGDTVEDREDKVVGSEILELWLSGIQYERWLDGKHPLQENARQCPNCGTWVANGCKVCINCGTGIEE